MLRVRTGPSECFVWLGEHIWRRWKPRHVGVGDEGRFRDTPSSFNGAGCRRGRLRLIRDLGESAAGRAVWRSFAGSPTARASRVGLLSCDGQPGASLDDAFATRSRGRDCDHRRVRRTATVISGREAGHGRLAPGLLEEDLLRGAEACVTLVPAQRAAPTAALSRVDTSVALRACWTGSRWR